MTAAIKFAHKAITGGRDYQEDYCQFDEDGGELLAVLADGMGGQGSAGSGARASATACQSFVANYRGVKGEIADRLQSALDASNADIARAKAEEPDLGDMGTTLIGAAVHDGGLQWVSVGDSLLYLYRDGGLVRLNEDHSLAPMLDKLAEEGQLTREEALHHRNRNAVRSAVMGSEIELTDLQEKARPLHTGDIVVLASDGLDTLDSDAIAEIIGHSAPAGPEAVANALLEAVEAVGKPDQDNTMVMVLTVQDSGKKAVSRAGVGIFAALVILLLGGAAAGAWFLKLWPFATQAAQSPVEDRSRNASPTPTPSRRDGTAPAPSLQPQPQQQQLQPQKQLQPQQPEKQREAAPTNTPGEALPATRADRKSFESLARPAATAPQGAINSITTPQQPSRQ